MSDLNMNYSNIFATLKDIIKFFRVLQKEEIKRSKKEANFHRKTKAKIVKIVKGKKGKSKKAI